MNNKVSGIWAFSFSFRMGQAWAYGKGGGREGEVEDAGDWGLPEREVPVEVEWAASLTGGGLALEGDGLLSLSRRETGAGGCRCRLEGFRVRNWGSSCLKVLVKEEVRGDGGPDVWAEFRFSVAPAELKGADGMMHALWKETVRHSCSPSQLKLRFFSASVGEPLSVFSQCPAQGLVLGICWRDGLLDTWAQASSKHSCEKARLGCHDQA